MYDILSLTYSTLLAVETVLWCTKKSCFKLLIFVSFLQKKISCSHSAPLSHLTSCTPTKCNLYLAHSLDTAASEPDLYRLLSFHVPSLMFLFHCLCRTKGSVQARGTPIHFVQRVGFTVRIC